MTESAAPTKRTGVDRLRRSFFRPSRGQAVVAVLVGVLAFAAVTQVRLAGQDDTYANLREAELIQALNGLQAASRKAERDIADLEATRDQLRSSTQRRTTALEQAQKEVQTLGVLAGTVPASGPGIQVTVDDPKGDLSLNHLLDGIEELRNAGVEAIEINDRVRVIAQTSFEDDPDGVRVDGVQPQAAVRHRRDRQPRHPRRGPAVPGRLHRRRGDGPRVGVDQEGRPRQRHGHPDPGQAPLRRTCARAVACVRQSRTRGAACFLKT